MTYWLRPVVCSKVSQSVCRSRELEILPEEQQCYWKLLWKGDPPPPAEEIHGTALVPTFSEPWFNSSLDSVRYSTSLALNSLFLLKLLELVSVPCQKKLN